MPIIPSSRTRLLVETTFDTSPREFTHSVAGSAFTLLSPRSPLKGALSPGPVWRAAVPATGTPELHPWDLAHAYVDEQKGRNAVPVQYVEPDLLQSFTHGPDSQEKAARLAEHLRVCGTAGADEDWPARDEFAWHLGDEYTQLRSARELVGAPAGNRVRVAILDTGYDPRHSTAPLHVLRELERDLVEDDTNATEPSNGGMGGNRGHGTATLAILAGRRTPPADDFLGGAPHVEVIPYRIATSVIHFWTSSMAAGLELASRAGAQVISVSMGGVPSRRWAAAVNEAYEAGVTICAAAGNNFGGFPTRELIWPARFQRVIAVCGATADRTPYEHDSFRMQGNFGPPGAMRTAIAAYTPNIPWAELGCRDVISLNGAGTSSATPQVAAAAALWLQRHTAPDTAQKWQIVEAVRHALFSTADSSPSEAARCFGNGLLRAREALDVPFDCTRPRAKKATVWFPLLNLLTGFDRLSEPKRRMFEVEAAQLAATDPELSPFMDDDSAAFELPPADRERIFRALRADRRASRALHEFLRGARS